MYLLPRGRPIARTHGSDRQGPVTFEAAGKVFDALETVDGRFQVIEQAMGTPKGRTAAAAYLSAFVEEMKRSGQSATVAPSG